VETFFARNLGGLIHARTRVPGRLGKATAARRACTWMRSLPEKRLNNGGSSRGSRGGKGLTQGDQPLGGRGSDTEPKCRVDPNDGCAAGDKRESIVCRTTSPEGGARCVSSARRDLCGGRGAILVPRPCLSGPRCLGHWLACVITSNLRRRQLPTAEHTSPPKKDKGRLAAKPPFVAENISHSIPTDHRLD
jgi:hypothetical protein